MPDDLFPDDDEYGQTPEAVGASPSADAVPSSKVVYCTSCGVHLDNLRIGQPCTNCGVPVGSAQQGGTKSTSGKAIASLVLGICSIIGCLFYGIPGIVCGILAIYFARGNKRAVSKGDSPVASLGMSNAGNICGIVGLSLSILATVLMVAYFIFVFTVMVPQMQQMNQNQQNNPAYQTQPAQPYPPQNNPAPLNPQPPPSTP